MVGITEMKTGIEGPRHDPYGYSEYIAHVNGRKIVLHNGLAEWVEIDGERTERLWCDKEADTPQQIFERESGMTVDEFEDAYYRLQHPSKCPKCGSREIEYESGFPGEELLMCQKCGKVLATEFNIGAVI